MMAWPVTSITPLVVAKFKNVMVGTPGLLEPASPRIYTIGADNVLSGPGFLISDFESNRIIGNSQFQGAQRVMNSAMSPVRGSVRSVHVYIDM
jgi:hypothetical protein